MFRCNITNRVSQPLERMIKVVVERREKTYPDGSKGWEIAKEIQMTESGYKQWMEQQPKS